MQWDKEEDDLFTFYKKAIRLRRDHATLRQGAYRTLWAGQGSGLYIYAREKDSDIIVIAMNVSDEPCSYPMMEAGQAFRRENILWQYGMEEQRLAPMGWMVAQITG